MNVEKLSWMDRLQLWLGRSDISINGSIYMKRWRFIRTRWFNARIHQILRSDADREHHDHPFSFWSLILRYGYIEHRIDGSKREIRAPALLFRKAEELHRVELFLDEVGRELPAWTFVITGPVRRKWGFLTKEAGWVTWQRFTEMKKAELGMDPTKDSPGQQGVFAAKSGY